MVSLPRSTTRSSFVLHSPSPSPCAMPRLRKRGHPRETDVFAHLTSTSTTPPSSSDLIAAWIHQLPTPSAITLPSNHSHLLHQPLASISPNPQQFSPTDKSQQKQPLAYGSHKRRATSPPSLSAPSPLRPLWPLATANSIQYPARRSIRLVRTRYQVGAQCHRCRLLLTCR